jgi:hypothetical protein
MTFNASSYAYSFTNEDAPAYAREWLSDNPEAGEDDISEWAHEFADSMAAVIYTWKALALYAAGITADEDEDLADMALLGVGLGACERIANAVVGLSYTWHRRILTEAAEAVLSDGLTCSHEGARCADLSCPNVAS